MVYINYFGMYLHFLAMISTNLLHWPWCTWSKFLPPPLSTFPFSIPLSHNNEPLPYLWGVQFLRYIYLYIHHSMYMVTTMPENQQIKLVSQFLKNYYLLIWVYITVMVVVGCVCASLSWFIYVSLVVLGSCWHRSKGFNLQSNLLNREEKTKGKWGYDGDVSVVVERATLVVSECYSHGFVSVQGHGIVPSISHIDSLIINYSPSHITAIFLRNHRCHF